MFKRPVDVVGMGRVTRLEAGTTAFKHGAYQDASKVSVPSMYREDDDIVIAGRVYPISGGDIESFEYAKMAIGPATAAD